jgi:hypothetical protein
VNAQLPESPHVNVSVHDFRSGESLDSHGVARHRLSSRLP